MSTRRQLLLTIIAALAVLAVFIGGVILFVTRDRDTHLTLTTSPLATSVTINGHDYGTVSTNTTLDVTHSGSLDVVVSRGGFTDYTTTLTDTDSEMSIDVELDPVSDSAFEVLEQDAQALKEAEVTQDQLETADEAYDQWPILHDLPRETESFRAYQGVSESGDNDFAIHLYLYNGNEDAGRDAFTDWLTEAGYTLDDYEVIEHIDDAQPPSYTLPDKPTNDDLTALDPDDIDVDDAPNHSQLSPDELAVAFATYTTTWDSANDLGRSDAIQRAQPLMSEDQADAVEAPEKPLLPPKWKSAARNDARSHSWPTSFALDSETGASATYSVSTCWAWISDSSAPEVDGARDYTITITEQDDGYAVTDYDYEDPDPFVDYDTDHCLR